MLVFAKSFFFPFSCSAHNFFSRFIDISLPTPVRPNCSVCSDPYCYCVFCRPVYLARPVWGVGVTGRCIFIRVAICVSYFHQSCYVRVVFSSELLYACRIFTRVAICVSYFHQSCYMRVVFSSELLYAYRIFIRVAICVLYFHQSCYMRIVFSSELLYAYRIFIRVAILFLWIWSSLECMMDLLTWAKVLEKTQTL